MAADQALEPSSVPDSRFAELETTCFVIMPFGTKEVMKERVDFDAIYRDVFSPAIGSVRTPEDRALTPRRTDRDFFSGSINQEMFEYIVYSRLAFADISGLNPNVLYELGVRHSVQESGTVLFRQAGHPIPFDISSIKVFEYDRARHAEARELIQRVVSGTLARNRLDSPVRLALRAQWRGGRTAAATGPGQTASVAAHDAAQARAEDFSAEGSRVVVTVSVR